MTEMTIRVAAVPCGASDAFMHPACCGSDLSGVEYHDLTIGQLLEQQIVYCDGCGERIVPTGVTQDLAECGVCGRNKPVCCDEGYEDLEDGTVRHVGAVCVDCCGNHKGATWDGKSVAGGTYERCE